jgi:hypothetical protein
LFTIYIYRQRNTQLIFRIAHSFDLHDACYSSFHSQYEVIQVNNRSGIKKYPYSWHPTIILNIVQDRIIAKPQPSRWKQISSHENAFFPPQTKEISPARARNA